MATPYEPEEERADQVIPGAEGAVRRVERKEDEGGRDFKPYNPSLGESKITTRIKKRINELKSARQTVLNAEDGKSIEGIWRDSEKLYVPHKYYSTALDDWQTKNSQPNPYSKIMTALALIVANNPEVVLKASNEEYEPKTEFIKALYSRSWKVGLCKEQLKNFVFNLGTKGFAVGRTYHRKITRTIRDLIFIDPETREPQYEEKEADLINEVWFENMNPWNCWFDDMALPGDPWSVRDWCWRQVVPLDSFRYNFAKFKNSKSVQAGGNTEADNSGYTTAIQNNYTSTDLVEVWYYENQETDEFHIVANGVLLTDEVSPLPYRHKRISATFTQWTPRSSTSIYGVGVIEAIKEDQEMIDKVRNMSLDQLILSVYQMFIHGPSTNFTEGKLRVAPGRLVQVSNPNDVKPMQFNPPSQQTVQWLEMLGSSIDESSGVTKSLSGEFIGKTAFEVQQNRNAGLRKLKVPLANIEYALVLEARNHIDLLQQVLTVPQDVRRIIGAKTYDEFLQDYQIHPENYFVAPGENPEKPQLFQSRSVRLNLEQDERTKGFQESKTTNSFYITPEVIRWEGEIEIQPQSVLAPSIELERQQTLDLFNIIAKLPTTSLSKAQKRLLKVFGEDPDHWMPTEEELAAKRQLEEMMMQEQSQMGQMMGGMSPPEGQTSVIPRSETEVSENPEMLSEQVPQL